MAIKPEPELSRIGIESVDPESFWTSLGLKPMLTKGDSAEFVSVFVCLYRLSERLRFRSTESLSRVEPPLDIPENLLGFATGKATKVEPALPLGYLEAPGIPALMHWTRSPERIPLGESPHSVYDLGKGVRAFEIAGRLLSGIRALPESLPEPLESGRIPKGKQGSGGGIPERSGLSGLDLIDHFPDLGEVESYIEIIGNPLRELPVNQTYRINPDSISPLPGEL